MRLDIDKIRKAHGTKLTELVVPEWASEETNGSPPTVLAKRLSVPEFLFLQELPHESPREQFEYMLSVVRLSLVNEDESPLFDDTNIDILADSPGIVARLGGELLELNGMVDREAKNSETAP